MAAAVDNLESAVKYLEDAEGLTRNASVLLERVAGTLADDAQIAATLLAEVGERSRRALAALEEVGVR